MYNLSIEQVRAYREAGFQMVPLIWKLKDPSFTALELLKKLRQASKHVFLLDSALTNQVSGRYSFLGWDPLLEVSAHSGFVEVRKGDEVERFKAMPQKVLKELVAAYRSPRLDDLPTFTGGFVGYFSYEYFQYMEPSLIFASQDDEGFKDMDLMLFDRLLVLDHQNNELLIIVNIPTQDYEAAYATVGDQFSQIIELITNGPSLAVTNGHVKGAWRELFSPSDFAQMIEKTKVHIYEGDIFQAVLSNRWDADFEGSLIDTYANLRQSNPSPYMFYLTSDAIEMAGASPETLVKVMDGQVETFPLAGTRPRGKTAEEDQALAADLLADEKELAEHNMLVDLGRNDIGRVSRFGNVAVPTYMDVHYYSHVMHIGSTVTGQLAENYDAIDALSAILPAGTLSGAPKIRACQIIQELEGKRRGIYGGAIGYIDLSGNLDTCIAIRLVFKKNGKITVRSGAGIVSDSQAANEYQECINKARAVMEAIDKQMRDSSSASSLVAPAPTKEVSQ